MHWFKVPSDNLAPVTRTGSIAVSFVELLFEECLYKRVASSGGEFHFRARKTQRFTALLKFRG
jgi:hypothetical protein